MDANALVKLVHVIKQMRTKVLNVLDKLLEKTGEQIVKLTVNGQLISLPGYGEKAYQLSFSYFTNRCIHKDNGTSHSSGAYQRCIVQRACSVPKAFTFKGCTLS